MGSGGQHEICLHNRMQDCRRHYRANNRARGIRRMPRVRVVAHGEVKQLENSGGDALMGNTRTHPEHDG